jgi:DNA-binding HxlR family transcriptional regulator
MPAPRGRMRANSDSCTASVALTPEGRELLEAYRPLDAWARRWAERT